MRWTPWVVLGLYLFAYRMLLGFDPAADSRVQGVARFLFDSTSSSPGLIFALTAFFLVSRRKRFAAVLGRQSAPALSGLALAPATLLFLWAYYVGLDYLLVPSLCLLLLGSALLVGGVPALRVMLFPGLFLMLALPVSTVVVNQISYSMQVANGGVTEWILTRVGLSAVSIADHVYFEKRIFQIIETCTGLRTVQTLFMASCVYIEVFGRRGRRAWLVVLSAPLIGLLVNEIRILSIVLNPYASISSVHTLQGLVTVAGGVLLVAAFDAVLGRFMSSAPRPPRPVPAPSVTTPQNGWLAFATLGLVFVAISVWVPSWEAPDLAEPRLARLSSAHDGWEVISRLPVDHDFFGSTRFTQTMLREYTKGNDRIELFMGADDSLRGSNRALSPKTVVPGSGWEIVQRGKGGLPGGDWYIARSLKGTRLIFHKNYNMDSFPVAFARSLVGLGRGPFRRPGRSIVVRLSTSVDRRPEGLAKAEERLDRFLESFEGPLAPYMEQDPARS